MKQESFSKPPPVPLLVLLSTLCTSEFLQRPAGIPLGSCALSPTTRIFDTIDSAPAMRSVLPLLILLALFIRLAASFLRALVPALPVNAVFESARRFLSSPSCFSLFLHFLPSPIICFPPRLPFTRHTPPCLLTRSFSFCSLPALPGGPGPRAPMTSFQSKSQGFSKTTQVQ